jgi:putative phosphoesterase
MRIAFISDIHGNFTAFQAVLADMDSQNIDQIVCLGDVVTMGPQPVEVLKVLRKMDCLFIKGNHDAAVLNPEIAAQYEITHYLIPDLLWCRDQITADDLNFINSFKSVQDIKLLNGMSILAFHGSPLSPTDIIQATTPVETLDAYFGENTADIFIGGHSHIQMQRRYGDKFILNSGSVGNVFKYVYTPGIVPSLLPWAEYMIISQTETSLSIDSRRVYFDTNELLQKVKESNLPGAAWWLKQYQE